jgi:hypothetical protein
MLRFDVLFIERHFGMEQDNMGSCKFFASACLYVEQTDLPVEGIKGFNQSVFLSKCPAFLLTVLSFLQVDSFVPKDLSLFRVGA